MSRLTGDEMGLLPVKQTLPEGVVRKEWFYYRPSTKEGWPGVFQFRPQYGSDPELGIQEGEVMIPAHSVGVPPADMKEAPIPEAGVGRLFRDGWNVEFNPEPHTCRVMAYKNVLHLREALLAKSAMQGKTLASIPAYKIRIGDLATAPRDVMQFGCSPANNAYMGGMLVRPDIEGATHPMRYMGGHLHFSVYPRCNLSGTRARIVQDYRLTLHDSDLYPTLVKWLDLCVGLPATFLWDRPEQYQRRKFYGRAGEYRAQIYPNQDVGLEYRVLGPEVFNHQGVHNLFTGLASLVLEKFWDRDELQFFPEELSEDLQKAINTGEGLERCLNEMPWVVNKDYLNLPLLKALKEKWAGKFNLSGDSSLGHDWGWREFAGEMLKEKVPNNLLADIWPKRTVLTFSEVEKLKLPSFNTQEDGYV